MCTTGEVWVVEDQGRGKGWSVYVFMYLWLPNESYRRGGGGGGGSAHVARFAATPAVVDTVTAAEHIQPRCGQNSK